MAARTHHVDTARVVASREQVKLLFGSPAGAGQQPPVVRLCREIVLRPAVARQLCALLAAALAEHERRFGASALGEPSASASVAPREAARQAQALAQVVRGLAVPIGFERSFKAVQGRLLPGRFLMGVSRLSLGTTADTRLTDVCRLAGMPARLSDVCARYLPFADYVHFGFEAGEGASTYKVYLEFWETIHRQIQQSQEPPRKALLHVGLKWDAAEPKRHSITSYTWYPWITADRIADRVSRLLAAQPDAGLRRAAEDLVSVAGARVPASDILYLEVAEEGNPRCSFDINVYRAGLRVAELYPLLSALCRRQSVGYAPFHAIYDGIRDQRFGHLAGGVDRRGAPFFTVYYGADDGYGARGPRVGTSAAPAGWRRSPWIEQTDAAARELLGRLQALEPSAGIEHSIAFVEPAVLAESFALRLRGPAVGGQDGGVLAVCRQLNMPLEHQYVFAGELPRAAVVAFGLELRGNQQLVRACVEPAGAPSEAPAPQPAGVLVRLEFAWELSGTERTSMARYCACPPAAARQIATSIQKAFYPEPGDPVFLLVDDVLDLLGARTRPGELLYAQAGKAGAEGHGFDVDGGRARLAMAELYPLLLALSRHFGADPQRFGERYEAARTQLFGHLSGGRDAEGHGYVGVSFTREPEDERRAGDIPPG